DLRLLKGGARPRHVGAAERRATTSRTRLASNLAGMDGRNRAHRTELHLKPGAGPGDRSQPEAVLLEEGSQPRGDDELAPVRHPELRLAAKVEGELTSLQDDLEVLDLRCIQPVARGAGPGEGVPGPPVDHPRRLDEGRGHKLDPR